MQKLIYSLEKYGLLNAVFGFKDYYMLLLFASYV